MGCTVGRCLRDATAQAGHAMSDDDYNDGLTTDDDYILHATFH